MLSCGVTVGAQKEKDYIEVGEDSPEFKSDAKPLSSNKQKKEKKLNNSPSRHLGNIWLDVNNLVM